MENVKKILNDVRGENLDPDKRAQKAVHLAEELLKITLLKMKRQERHEQKLLSRMMQDEKGKVFVQQMTDQIFRSKRPTRVANQLIALLNQFGMPKFLRWYQKVGLYFIKKLIGFFPDFFVPTIKRWVLSKTHKVIIPLDKGVLDVYLAKKRHEGTSVNINYLGEAILGEEEAENRMAIYLNFLKDPKVECISVKISSIYSQINALAREHTLEKLKHRFRQLLRAGSSFRYRRSNGDVVDKFVNLDMEEWADLDLTVTLFMEVLDEPEFHKCSSGLALQSYIPDSFLWQKKLTEWAMKRVEKGGGPIKIRLVKGANLAMEKVDASIRVWPQATYRSKEDTDANFIKMLHYALEKDHAKAVHIGIGSHNLFLVAYALMLREERELGDLVVFEMLQGMAPTLSKVIQSVVGELLVYCPVTSQEEFQNGVAYLVRRFDENTGKENFLRHIFNLRPKTKVFREQAQRFIDSVKDCDNVRSDSYRDKSLSRTCCFQNEPDTDFSLRKNQNWIKETIQKIQAVDPGTLPLCIGDQWVQKNETVEGIDPSQPAKVFYRYSRGTKEDAGKAVEVAKSGLLQWKSAPKEELFGNIIKNLREKRGHLIAVMVADGGKTVEEADAEVSEAIDFAKYYLNMMTDWSSLKDISFTPKGVVLVASPWNFPCSIPSGGILAALVTGNTVIFKPAPQTVFVGWELAKIFWESGVPKEALQFLTGTDEEIGSSLITHPHIASVILTGATQTAKELLLLRPGLDLMAETGGKNAIIVTSMADRDLAIQCIIRSAFGHSGQKCSACSLLILEDEVYRDEQFKKQLKDTAASLEVGSSWDLATKVNPLIQPAENPLLEALTSLEGDEEWLLEPKQDPNNPHLWSPGIKWGVKVGSSTQTKELFGPVLGVMWAKDLKQAISMANGTEYGLCAGLHSLDEREHQLWQEKIRAGNLYINRTITGAVVQRQPFGGCKSSNFGPGSKAGGPNYIVQLMNHEQVGLPKEREPLNEKLRPLDTFVRERLLFEGDRNLWATSVESYQFYWTHYFSKRCDPTKVLGEDNLFYYTPHKLVVVRAEFGDLWIDLLRVCLACRLVGATFEVSIDPSFEKKIPSKEVLGAVEIFMETEKNFLERMSKGSSQRIRMLRPSSSEMKEVAANSFTYIAREKVLANGRLELLHYLREQSLCFDYHRFGNIGLRKDDNVCKSKC